MKKQESASINLPKRRVWWVFWLSLLTVLLFIGMLLIDSPSALFAFAACAAVSCGFVSFLLYRLYQDLKQKEGLEEQIVANEERYRNLIENAGPVLYTADNKGLITFASKKVAELTGYSVDELTGQHFAFLIDPSWRERVVKFYIDQYVSEKKDTQLEFLTCTKQGKQKWVEQSSQLLYKDGQISGFQCMVKDITERKRVEEELSISEAARKQEEYRFNAIFDNTSTLIFTKDLAGRYVMANRRFKEVFNLTDEMLLHKTDFDLNTQEQAEHYRKVDEEVITSLRPVQVEEMIKTAEGNRTLLLVKFPLLDENKQPFGISGIATDITERIQASRQLEEALRSAEEAKELQEQFLANMSHEIRTPLNGIHGMTALLLETELNKEQKEFTSTISRSLNDLLALTNNILDFSNIKIGKLTLQKAPFSVREVVENVRAQFDYFARKKGLDFEVLINERVPQQVTGDAGRLKQILVNLVDNAIKFTEKGSIRIEVFLLEQHNEDSKISFSIIDTGIGIPREKLETIFKSFAQANMAISQGYGGAGLGLAISKGLIEMQGGNISVRSMENNGSIFRFIISYAGDQEETKKSPEKNNVEELRNKRFLVAEDNPVNQRLISFVLQKVGGITDIASNGKEAIDMLEADPGYDLILMDVQMPVMGGYETTTYIRETMKLQTPIIALTATALKEDQDKCIEVGMNDFILKPFDFKDLYERIRRLILNMPVMQQSSTKPVIPSGKLYDLSLLEELEDPKYVYDMIRFFLESAPSDIAKLSPLCEQQNWDELHKVAHKAKGAAGMLQATALLRTLAKIEADSRDKNELASIPAKTEEANLLFAELVKQLGEEMIGLEKAMKEKD